MGASMSASRRMAKHDSEYMEDVIARLKAALLEAEVNFNDVRDHAGYPDRALALARNGAQRVRKHVLLATQFRTALTPETSRYDD